ncbi:MAG: aspartate kinase [Planctomycetaceae bacterium]|jgi:aspartate kinase|nr:aspartate kinase [Planctomycetaceae bacterium]
MSIIVQKFGGTSVADTNKIREAARKAIRAKQRGNQVVMVVSAMGKETDKLIALAHELMEHPDSREMDMLMSTGEQVTISLMAIALKSLGEDAVSMTAAQIGIKTDNSHLKARIKSISTERMQKALDSGKIVIAAGFQGINDEGNITTLGRGGSDTTAVALAAALGAKECEIYTDVDGVYTTDPRLLPEARKVTRIAYDEMLELASLGAGVMHSRSIEFAKKFGVAVHVRSSFSDTEGSLIVAEPESLAATVCGLALAKKESRLTILDVPDQQGIAMQIFERMAEAKIATDMIVQSVGSDGLTDISFTVPELDRQTALEVLRKASNEIGAGGVEYEDDVTKISAVGLGMAEQSGVAHRMFRALSDSGVNIKMITTSEIKISALIEKEKAGDALRALHKAFGLEKLAVLPNGKSGNVNAKKSAKRGLSQGQTMQTPAEVLARHKSVSNFGMEDILIERVSLDQKQASVTLSALPDKPGVAATIFEMIASEGILVDMIVQSNGDGQVASFTFTVLRNNLRTTLSVCEKINKKLGGRITVTNHPAIAKLTLRGTGLRSHTGLAYRMFKTLHDGKINVNVISTSEVCVSVVVDDEQGEKGKKLLETEFKNELL